MVNENHEDYGTCCICESDENVRNIGVCYADNIDAL